MIRGIGTDVVHIARVEQALRNPRFAQRILSPQELDEWRIRGEQAQDCAARWAVKEAAVKALGCGFVGIGLREIGLLHDAHGAPQVVMTGRAAELGAGRWWVSVSHDAGVALAFVIWEAE